MFSHPSNMAELSGLNASAISPSLVHSKTKLMISNIPANTIDTDLKPLFEQFCDTMDVGSKVLACKGSNGCAFVLFSDKESAQRAKDANIQLENGPLQMRFAMTLGNDDFPLSQSRSKFAKPNFGAMNMQFVSKFPALNNNSFKIMKEDISMDSDSSGNTFGDESCSNSTPTPSHKHGAVGPLGAANISFSNLSNDDKKKPIIKIENDDQRSLHGTTTTINVGYGNLVFGYRLPYLARKLRLESIERQVISEQSAYSLINDYIGTKETPILILGELDFSFAASIVKAIGSGHSIISSSLHTNNDMRKFSYECRCGINRNLNTLQRFRTSYNQSESLVLRGVDATKLRSSLTEALGLGVGDVISFDKILFALPFCIGSNHFDVRNMVFTKRLFESVNKVVNRSEKKKPEIHFLFPIFASRSQFDSYKIEEIGKFCKLKWRLKTALILDSVKLGYAFDGYVQRENSGRVINKKGVNMQRQYRRQRYFRGFRYMGYYIMQTI